MPTEVTSYTGLLSSEEIESYGLVETIGNGCLQVASCDLTVGDRHYVYENTGSWKAIFLDNATKLAEANEGIPAGSEWQLLPPRQGGGKLVIPAFGSAIVQLAETVDLLTVANKDNLLIAGRFDLKLKSIYKGLISQQATQVEPCYKGKLYCFLYNLGSQEVVLKMGDKLATIEFSYAGQGLSDDQRKEVIKKTIDEKNSKFKGGNFSGKQEGIKDVRWLHEQGMLPNECGIAPIYNLANGNVSTAVTRHLETSDAVEQMAERVGNKLSDKHNSFKTLIALITAVITLFTSGFLINVTAELRYFQEELTFFGDSVSGSLDSDALQAIKEHTESLANLRCLTLTIAIICILVIVALLMLFFHVQTRPKGAQKWVDKKKESEAKAEYYRFKNDAEGINH